MRCYRRLSKVFWKDNINRKIVREKVESRCAVEDMIKQRKLKLYRHICRMKTVMLGVVARPHGRPLSEAVQLALDRKKWRTITGQFKLAVIVYRALHGTAPQYLCGQLRYVADLPSRHRLWLRLSTSSLLDVRPSRLVTIGDRSFAAAGPRLWNGLPVDVQSAPSLATFRQKLKSTFIPAIIPRHCFFNCFAIVVLEVTVT